MWNVSCIGPCRSTRGLTMATKPNGAVLWRGASLLDGAPIVAIVTGLANRSGNAKTGAMLQTWILRADVDPWDAIKTGADASICGDCKHRGKMAQGQIPGNSPTQKMVGRTCYVRVYQAPKSIYKALHRGRYADASDADARAYGAGRAVRIGAYGDPAAVPAHVWRNLIAEASSHTGYTHQWRTAADLRGIVMASADSAAEMDDARAMGWRTFRVRANGDPLGALESVCPASAEAGHLTDCAACGACNGAATGRRGSIAIMVHGAMAKHFAI